MGELWQNDSEMPSLATPATGSECQHTHLNLLFKMVSFVLDESAQIISMYFRTKIVDFASGLEPNRASFLGNDLEFILVAKNTFQWYIICLCLKSFAKSQVFRENL